jgi:hypothetical protein
MQAATNNLFIGNPDLPATSTVNGSAWNAPYRAASFYELRLIETSKNFQQHQNNAE